MQEQRHDDQQNAAGSQPGPGTGGTEQAGGAGTTRRVVPPSVVPPAVVPPAVVPPAVGAPAASAPAAKKAKKRLNKRFAVTLLAVVGGLAIVGGAAVMVLRPKDTPERLEMMSDAALAAGDLDGAYTAFRRAVAAEPTPERLVRLGDLARAASVVKPELRGQDIANYRAALEQDPRFVPALKKIVEFNHELVRARVATPQVFQEFRQMAERLVAVDPSDRQAAALIPMSHIQEWLRPELSVEPEVVESALTRLSELVEQDPSDAEAVTVLVQGLIKRAAERGGRRDASTPLFSEAMAVLDKAVERQPENLKLLVQASNLYGFIAGNDPALREAAVQRRRDAITKARSLAGPNDPQFVEVSILAAAEAQATRGRDAADEIYRSALERLPQSQPLRLAYAEFLSRLPQTRAQAIELLQRPVELTEAERNSPFASLRLQQLKTLTDLNLQEYRIEEASATTDNARRQALLSAAQADLQRLGVELPDDYRVLALQGRLALLQNRNVDAITLLERARLAADRAGAEARAGTLDPSLLQARREIMIRLSDAYRLAGQSGKQRDLLREVVAELPGYIPARAQLVELLLREGNREAALAEYRSAMAELQRQESAARPEQAEQIALFRRAMDAVGLRFSGTEGVATRSPLELLREMPESDRRQRMLKAQAALQLRQFAEAARVAQVDFAADAKDVDAAGLLIQALAADGRQDQAREVLQMALQASPNDTRLKVLEVQLGGGSREDLERLLEEQVRANPDPFLREMQLYQLAMQRGDRAKALEHLKAAEGINPDDRGVMDQRFQNALLDRDWATAERLLPRLVSSNADQAGGRLYRFRLLAARGQAADALRVATELSQALPNFALSWTTLGQAQALNRDFARAVTSFEQALRLKPDERGALLGLVEAAYALGRPDDARRYINDALQRLPGDRDFTRLAMEHDLRFGDPERSAEFRDRQITELMNRADEVRKRMMAAEGEAKAQAEAELNDLERLLGETYAQAGQTFMQAAQARAARGDLQGARELAGRALTVLTLAAERRPEDVGVMGLLARVALLNPNPAAVEPLLRRMADSPGLSQRPEPMLVLGEYYLLLGRAEPAEASVREAIKRGGTDVAVRSTAANVLQQLGKPDDALAVLNDADGAATSRQLQRQRIEILLQAGRFDQAERAIRAQLQQTPDDADLSNLLVVALMSTNRFDEAQQIVRDLLLRDPQNLSATYFRGLIELRRPDGDLASAVRDLRTVRETGRLNAEQRMALVEALQRTNDPNGAIVEMRDLLAGNPTNKLLRMQLIEAMLRTTPPRPQEALVVVDEGLARPEFANDVDLLLTRARVLLALGNADDAVTSARRAVELSRSSPTAVRAYLDTLVAARQSTQVLRETEEMARANVRPWWAFVARAVARHQLNDTTGAINEFSAALQAASEANDDEGVTAAAATLAQTLGADNAIRAMSTRLDESVRFRLLTAQLLASQRRFPEALGVMEPALARLDNLAPDEQVRVLKLTASLLVSPGPQQNYDRAADLYRRLARMVPEDIPVLNNLAFVLTEKVTSPNPAEALQYSTRAVEILRRQGQVEPLVFDTHGWVLVQNNRVAEGINFLTEAVERRSFVEGHMHLGLAYLKFGLPREATEQLERARRLAEAPTADPRYRERIDQALQEAALAIERQTAPGGTRGR
ncbi:MAG: tetratricopeptide repeat protein [Tepidisphaerales bacterium]